MGHHINERGNFQSDKDPTLPENKITLSFKDPIAQKVLWLYAELTEDDELSQDICQVLREKSSSPNFAEDRFKADKENTELHEILRKILTAVDLWAHNTKYHT